MSDSERDLGYPTGVHGNIPSFNNVEEEAAFWDTHDATDYLDQGRPVKIVVEGELAERLTLRLAPDDRDALTELAKAKGVGPASLIRIWVRERLQHEVAAQPR